MSYQSPKTKQNLKCQAERRQNGKLPDTGYFSMVDLKAPVYNPLKSKVNTEDVSQRSKDKWISDMIWNSNWIEWMEIEETMRKKRKEMKSQAQGNRQGFISIARRDELYSQDKDFDEELKEAKKQYELREQMRKEMAQKIRNQELKYEQPGKDERNYWKRQGKYTKRNQLLDEEDKEALSPSQSQIESQKQFEEDNQQSQIWTLGIGVGGSVLIFALQNQDYALSFLMGNFFSLIYLRMLARSIEAIGGNSGLGFLGQPRILIPLLLGLIYNKWDKVDYIDPPFDLDFFALSGGFLSFKIAVVFRQVNKLVSEYIQGLQNQTAERKRILGLNTNTSDENK